MMNRYIFKFTLLFIFSFLNWGEIFSAEMEELPIQISDKVEDFSAASSLSIAKILHLDSAQENTCLLLAVFDPSGLVSAGVPRIIIKDRDKKIIFDCIPSRIDAVGKWMLIPRKIFIKGNLTPKTQERDDISFYFIRFKQSLSNTIYFNIYNLNDGGGGEEIKSIYAASWKNSE